MQIKELLLLVLIFSLNCYSQNKNIVKHNDSLVGNENLPINNGLVYYNKYKITSEKTSQFLENKYNLGIVKYNGETYFDINLKYDVFEDVLIFKPTTQLAIETCFISKQVDYFILKDKKISKIRNCNQQPKYFWFF